MNVELITREDFKRLENLLNEIKQIVKPGQSQPKKWLKSSEVRKMLNISPGTLRNLRINGTLRLQKWAVLFITNLKTSTSNELAEYGRLIRRMGNDERLLATHVSLFTALVIFWQRNEYVSPFTITRKTLMVFSKIASVATYISV